MSESEKPLDWCRVVLDEYPPEGVVVWTTDGETVAQGVWCCDDPGIPFEESTWEDLEGNSLKVTQWLPLEESPDSPPQAPTS